jgi:hypothetical protein
VSRALLRWQLLLETDVLQLQGCWVQATKRYVARDDRRMSPVVLTEARRSQMNRWPIVTAVDLDIGFRDLIICHIATWGNKLDGKFGRCSIDEPNSAPNSDGARMCRDF